MIRNLLLKLRQLKYAFWSNNKQVSGRFIGKYPVIFRGKGSISIGENVQLGVVNSPNFLNSYAYIEARGTKAKISFGNNISINNHFSVISEHQITIEDEVLIGLNCHITDSNFHDLNPLKRAQTDSNPQSVTIERNVFIGNFVTILKGVTIGENSVVGSHSVVTRSVPANVVVAGNPAQIVKELS